jgi:3-oxoacyl-[acyl-carrier protein] reductase
MQLENKVAVVTGGNRGIGKAIALTLAQNGASVAFCDVGTQLGETAAEIEKTGVKALAVTADITKADQVEAFAKAVLDTFGKVDILVNNAGITRDNLLIRMSEKEWDDVITVNLKGAFLVSKAFLRSMMKARTGRIINIASIIGVRGNAGQANYAASKAGIIGLTKTTAREFAGRNINCNAVAPGFIQTDMTKVLSEKTLQELMTQIPLGFLGETSDVANVVLFLASDAARYITGQVICVDGGMVI